MGKFRGETGLHGDRMGCREGERVAEWENRVKGREGRRMGVRVRE